MSGCKKLIAILLAVVLSIALTGCNKQLVDLTYAYDRAIICLPNGEVVDGKTYLVHSSNIVLIAE